jgi:hypothetical protein
LEYEFFLIAGIIGGHFMSANSTRVPPRPQTLDLVHLREFPHLYALKDENGEVIATVNEQYAKHFQALPDLLAASQEIFERLKGQYSEWGQQSSLGRLEKAISLFRPVKGSS